jgi:hypothetical protein
MLVAASRQTNRRDYDAVANGFAATVRDVVAKDRVRQSRRQQAAI